MGKLIGFIGQGWIGKNYADNFEQRGFEVVCYSLEPEYVNNKEKIKDCDIVFIAVPTPTTTKGFDFSAVESALLLICKSGVAVIKSTILPGTVDKLQEKFPDIFIVHSPEFLTEATAAYDAANPIFNIIGVPIMREDYLAIAREIMSILPRAKVEKICLAKEAEFFKYVRNSFFFTKVVYMNLLYELAQTLGCDWSGIRNLLKDDPWVGPMHIDPVHKSGRGAGGHCFIKDFAAFAKFYQDMVKDDPGGEVFKSLENKNIELLIGSNKDLDLVKDVYPEVFLNRQ